MTCQNYKNLMMGYLDNELEDEQRRAFEDHLASCRQCQAELDDFKNLKKITDDIALAEPEDKLWDMYWSGIYNRIERSTGWILSSLATILLLIYGGFRAIEELVKDPTVDIILKTGLLVLIAGLAILLVSVLRERLYFRKKDRYKDVRR
ncbi:MAG: zf-HC2 domain-containing protein [Sedimentisphaerales bacterium]|nr:zf-HC2 domain-containing protein [Sedimentisphaerales bacterium]